jgi:hypothetical protein
MNAISWWKSLTLRGVALTALSVFAPKYVALIPPIVGNLGTIPGLVFTTIGRIRTARQVTFGAQK